MVMRAGRRVGSQCRIGGEVLEAPLFKGPAWRAPTGYQHGKEATAADVVHYEQEELGNDLGISERMVVALSKCSAEAIVWVGRSKKAVSRYGKPEPYEAEGHPIIAVDGEGGYLVLRLDKCPCDFGPGGEKPNAKGA